MFTQGHGRDLGQLSQIGDGRHGARVKQPGAAREAQAHAAQTRAPVRGEEGSTGLRGRFKYAFQALQSALGSVLDI